MLSVGATSAQDEMIGDGVVAAFAQGLAAQDAPAAQYRASQGAEACYGNAGVIGTRWMEAAAGPEQGTQPPFV